MERQNDRRCIMKRLYVTALIAALCFIFVSASQGYPGEEKYNCKYYHAYISGDMSDWPDWIRQMEKELGDHPQPRLRYDIVLAHYGYVAYLIGAGKDEAASEYIENGEMHLDALRIFPEYTSRYEAMQGAFIAFKIGLNRSKAVWLGPKSMGHINRAVELDSTNPVAWMEKANAEYHMPRVFGGSYAKAVEYYQKAVGFFEQHDARIHCNWLYINALAWLARSCEKANMDTRAKLTYLKILALEPDFQWVKEDLYPAFQNRN
jgi:tetratricopeptide (TPR) repeat protein